MRAWNFEAFLHQMCGLKTDQSQEESRGEQICVLRKQKQFSINFSQIYVKYLVREELRSRCLRA